MSKYQRSILVTAIIISLPSLFLFVVGVVKMSMTHLGIWGVILALWWGAYFYLRKGSKRSFWISFSLINLLWWPLLWQTGQRVVFIIENGGMERADGYGSPLAFLIGLVGEQLFFLPLCFPMFFGAMAIKSLKNV